MTLAGSDVPEESVSDQLTSYPEELLQSPEDTATASLQVEPGGPALAEQRSDVPGASILPRGADRWTRALDDLVSGQDLTLGFGALAFGIALFLGAMHALGPGHGKTLMAATAAARDRARMRDVLPMAASVTVTHTLGVVALGLLVLMRLRRRPVRDHLAGHRERPLRDGSGRDPRPARLAEPQAGAHAGAGPRTRTRTHARS